MKQYIYKIGVFLGFLALGPSHLQAAKIVFHYGEDKFDVMDSLEGVTKKAVGDYSEKPDVAERDLARNPSTRFFENVLDFLMPLEGAGTKSPTYLHDIYGAALKLFNAASQEHPQTLVFLGRAPTFLKEMVQQLYKLEPKENMPSLVQVPFSGSPDIKSLHPGLKKFSYLRNVLTPNRIKVFFQHLDALGFDKITGEMWVVDTMGSGGSLNSFLRLLKEYYHRKEKVFPDFRFWGMNFAEYDGVCSTETFYFDHAKKTLSFSDKFSKLGYKAMDIPCFPLLIDPKTSSLMDNDLMEYFYGGVQEYPAWKMKGLQKNPIPPQAPGKDFLLFRDKILVPLVNILHAKGTHALDPLTLEQRMDLMWTLLQWMDVEEIVEPSFRDTVLREMIQSARAKAPAHQQKDVIPFIKKMLMQDVYKQKEKQLTDVVPTYSPQGAV